MSLLLGLALAQGLLPAPDPAQDTPPLGSERVVLRTPCGDLVAALYPSAAPRTAAQFLKLVRAGVYDGTRIHRIAPSFVVQVSHSYDRREPLTAEQKALIARLPLEKSALKHVHGTLSMARADGDPDSAETSFSILLGPAPHLDGQYTAFGMLQSGWDVLDLLSRLKSSGSEEPRVPLSILKAEVHPSSGAAAAAWPAKAAVPPEALSPERVILRTDVGDLVMAFYPDVAPRTVAQVLQMVRDGVYDGTAFRPAVPGQHFQALGHGSRQVPLDAGTASRISRLPLETSLLPHRRGELSMSRDPADRESGTSSFVIMLGAMPHLDRDYAVFGRVIQGEELLSHVERIIAARPAFQVRVRRAELVEDAAHLASMRIQGPIEPTGPTRHQLTNLTLGWIMLLAAGAAAGYLPAPLLSRRLRVTMMVSVLVAGYPLFLASVTAAPAAGDPLFSAAVFCAAVLFFRLMNRFEGAPPPSKPPGLTSAKAP